MLNPLQSEMDESSTETQTSKWRGTLVQKTKVIDACGQLVLPGANDSHIHATHTGYTLSPEFMDLSGPEFNSMDKILSEVKSACENAGPGEWVFGCGFVDEAIKELADENRIMNRYDPDPVSQEGVWKFFCK